MGCISGKVEIDFQMVGTFGCPDISNWHSHSKTQMRVREICVKGRIISHTAGADTGFRKGGGGGGGVRVTVKDREGWSGRYFCKLCVICDYSVIYQWIQTYYTSN